MRFKTFVVAMVALRNACARRYVLLCHVFCFWHFATRTLQFSALPPNSKLLKDVERNEVTNWVREQMCDLGYDEGVSDKMAEALSFYGPSALAEASRESLLGALQQTSDSPILVTSALLHFTSEGPVQSTQPIAQSSQPSLAVSLSAQSSTYQTETAERQRRIWPC